MRRGWQGGLCAAAAAETSVSAVCPQPACRVCTRPGSSAGGGRSQALDHRAIPADGDLHRHAVESLSRADALLFGRVTYEMMQSAWRPPAGARPDWMEPFAETINAAKKYVVSSTLEQVDWNAELVRGDLGEAAQRLKRESGKGLLVGGVKLPLALAELGLIDEYELVVHPRLAGHGPTLFAGLSKHVDLKLVSRLELDSGAVAIRYEPRR